jgi:hypothetical protein
MMSFFLARVKATFTLRQSHRSSPTFVTVLRC